MGQPIGGSPAAVPFGVKPPRKLGVLDVAEILRGVIPAQRSSGSPTQEGAVFELRPDLPPEIGCVYWRTSGEPSLNALLPWYLGINETPPGYYQAVDLKQQLELKYHLSPPASGPEAAWPKAWRALQELQSQVQKDVARRLPIVQPAWKAIEKRAIDEQPGVAKKAAELWKNDPAAARTYLTQYSGDLADQASRTAERLLQQMR